MNKLHLRKGDTVRIILGRDRGSEGKVLEVSTSEKKVIIEGLNMVTKHVKPRKQGEAGGLVKAESPLYASKVMVVCPKCKKATRTGNTVQNGKNLRVCKKCGAAF